MLIQQGIEPDSHFTITFSRDPSLGLALISLINEQDDNLMDTNPAYFAALTFALDVCVAQFQSEAEAHIKAAKKNLLQLMDYLADIILQGKHQLSFWMPILNSFYDVHVDVTDKLRDAYMEIACLEEESADEEVDPLIEIREMIHELSDLTDYDIAENFFSQSHAMPPEFFAELVVDLYSLPEGQEIALLTLLHPNREVREVVVSTIDHLMPQLLLSSKALTRLNRIKDWYPLEAQETIDRWIKFQRKKGVVFQTHQKSMPPINIRATEVDGSGAQGLFIQIKANRKTRLCGLLLKLGYGIKDVWITDPLTKKEVDAYYLDAFDSNVTLREVEIDYLMMMGAHFIASNKKFDHVPNLYFLELEELLGLHFHEEPIDVDSLIETLGVQISPFTHEAMLLSFKRSKSWLTTKSFTETWYIETADVDKWVNRCSSYVNGIKVCDISKAIDFIIEHELEVERSLWIFHFLWVTLWLKSHPKKNEKAWQDSFYIVYALATGFPVADIPVMQEVARQTVINSVETMQDRKTHLSTE